MYLTLCYSQYFKLYYNALTLSNKILAHFLNKTMHRNGNKPSLWFRIGFLEMSATEQNWTFDVKLLLKKIKR